MGSNWVECLLEEYPELYDVLDCSSLDVRVILSKKIMDFKDVKEIKVTNGELYIDDYKIPELLEINKIVTKHNFSEIRHFSKDVLLHETSKLVSNDELYVECSYYPSMRIKSKA